MRHDEMKSCCVLAVSNDYDKRSDVYLVDLKNGTARVG